MNLRLYRDETTTESGLELLNKCFSIFKTDNPKWLGRNECLGMKSFESSLIIFAKFEGVAFEHVRSCQGRIVSPLIIIDSISNKKRLPKSEIPVFSSSFKELIICCTNIDKTLRADIYKKVEMMQGKITKIFTESVTHLITTEVGSLKYHGAASLNLPIMLPEWINHVWDMNETTETKATDPIFDKYKCPIFNRLYISATGFDEEQKEELKNIIESNGGFYMPDLVLYKTTHLIAKEPKGQKYDHAKHWKIAIVKQDWISDSLKAAYCLKEKNYQLETPDNQTSTPTTDTRTLKSKLQTTISDISVIGGNNPNNTTTNTTTNSSAKSDKGETLLVGKLMYKNKVNETGHNTTLSTTINSSKMFSLPTTPTTTAASNNSQILKDLNSIGKIKINLFDGLGVKKLFF
jgi:hypothetical protein